MLFAAWSTSPPAWSVAVTIFVACKLLTWLRTPTPPAPAWRHVAYLFAWPGLDARAFLDPRPLPNEQRPTPGEWLFALTKLAFGVALMWGVAPLVEPELLRGWVGMAGLIFVLHFGTFHLISCFWRAVGVDAKPLMVWPLLAANLSDFWGKRWNTAFRDLTYRFLFRPLTPRVGAHWALVAVFVFSGVVHDLVISLPPRGGYGLPTLYFVIQCLGLLAEKSKFGKRLGLGAGWRGRAFTALVVIGPAYWLFHPPYVFRVVLPFMERLGAH